MNARTGILWAVVFLTACATARDVADPAPPPPPQAGLAVSQLIELEHARADSIAQADAFSVEELLEEGYRGLTWDGHRRTKNQEVQWVRAAGARAQLKLALASDELEVRVYGNFAVVTGRVNQENIGTQDRNYRQIRFTHVWLWRDARWQLVAAH